MSLAIIEPGERIDTRPRGEHKTSGSWDPFVRDGEFDAIIVRLCYHEYRRMSTRVSFRGDESVSRTRYAAERNELYIATGVYPP